MASYIHITGPSGPLPGESTRAGLEEYTQVLSVYQELALPEARGVTGRGGTIAGMFSFTKALDRISPLLAKILELGQPVSAQLRVVVSQIQQASAPPAHVWTLQQGRIMELRREQPLGDESDGIILEHVSIAFNKLTHVTAQNTESTITIAGHRA